MSEYNQLKGQLAALNRKRTGNLAVRDLSNIVDAEVSTGTDPRCSRAQELQDAMLAEPATA